MHILRVVSYLPVVVGVGPLFCVQWPVRGKSSFPWQLWIELAHHSPLISTHMISKASCGDADHRHQHRLQMQLGHRPSDGHWEQLVQHPNSGWKEWPHRWELFWKSCGCQTPPSSQIAAPTLDLCVTNSGPGLQLR